MRGRGYGEFWKFKKMDKQPPPLCGPGNTTWMDRSKLGILYERGNLFHETPVNIQVEANQVYQRGPTGVNDAYMPFIEMTCPPGHKVKHGKIRGRCCNEDCRMGSNAGRPVTVCNCLNRDIKGKFDAKVGCDTMYDEFWSSYLVCEYDATLDSEDSVAIHNRQYEIKYWPKPGFWVHYTWVRTN
jgi:hypothetical protein